MSYKLNIRQGIHRVDGHTYIVLFYMYLSGIFLELSTQNISLPKCGGPKVLGTWDKRSATTQGARECSVEKETTHSIKIKWEIFWE